MASSLPEDAAICPEMIPVTSVVPAKLDLDSLLSQAGNSAGLSSQGLGGDTEQPHATHPLAQCCGTEWGLMLGASCDLSAPPLCFPTW